MSEVDLERARELVEGGDAQIVDVRTADERAEGTIPGALGIELGELPERVSELDRDRPVVFYCASGGRSQMASEALNAAGYEAHSVAGGIEAWIDRGFPVDPSVD